MVASGAVLVALERPLLGRILGDGIRVRVRVRRGSFQCVDWVRGASFRMEGDYGDTCPYCQQEQKSGVNGFPAFPVGGCWHGQQSKVCACVCVHVFIGESFLAVIRESGA